MFGYGLREQDVLLVDIAPTGPAGLSWWHRRGVNPDRSVGQALLAWAIGDHVLVVDTRGAPSM